MRFETFGNFKLPYAGLLWQKFRSEYPKVEHAAPLTTADTMVIDAATGAPLPRIWFINEADDELIQFQPDRLYFNWRRRQREYPRFEAILPKFKAAKEAFDSMLADLNEKPLAPLEQEITYIDHIPQGEGWQTLDDLPKILPMFQVGLQKFQRLPNPNNLAWRMRFELPDAAGNLDVQVSRAQRKKDQHPIISLQFGARGKSTSADWETTEKWFWQAHDRIVDAFLELTSQDIQLKVWERVE